MSSRHKNKRVILEKESAVPIDENGVQADLSKVEVIAEI